MTGSVNSVLGRRRQPERKLQAQLVDFFARAVLPGQAILFAVPNGEERDATTAAMLVGMRAAVRARLPDEAALLPAGQGVLPGVADLMLMLSGGQLVPVEVKIPETREVDGSIRHRKGAQHRMQRLFEAAAKALGYDYRIVKSEAEFAALLVEKGVRLRFQPWWPVAPSPAVAPPPPSARSSAKRASASLRRPGSFDRA